MVCHKDRANGSKRFHHFFWILLSIWVPVICHAVEAKAVTKYYEYDINGKLTKVTTSDGMVYRYAYDAAGNITSRIITSDFDGDGLSDLVESAWGCLDSHDADTDDDGIPDGVEDANHNGMQDPGETHPCKIDSDGDGIQDGTELGYTLNDVGPDTNLDNFQQDLDPATTTNPLNSDTDGDGIPDGVEDPNLNGRKDPGETDPNEQDESIVYIEPEGKCDSKTPCYSTIQAALNAAKAGDTLRVAHSTPPETPVWSKSHSVSISGGWKPDFSGQNGITKIYAPRATGGGGIKVEPNVNVVAQP